MSWYQVSCQSLITEQAAITERLETLGALSITYSDAKDNAIYEPKPGETRLWDQLIITALFSQSAAIDKIEYALQLQTFITPSLSHIKVEQLGEQVWERTWMEHFKPICFGQKLWIYPTTYECPDDESVQVILDPGLAFGTGTHPTTHLCLEWLDQHPPVDLSMVDYGCGTGILAIAALKLGARHATAVDIDEQALLATHENCLTNAIDSHSIHTCFPHQIDTEITTVDLVMANILSGPLIELAPLLTSLCNPNNGQLVLSGILIEQKDAVVSHYQQWLTHIKIKEKEGWIRISGKRKDNLT